MHLTLTVTKDEIVRVVTELTPVKIDLGKKRSVTFGAPERIELVPDTGLRIRGNARLAWDLAGMPLPVTLRAWQLLLVPTVERREGGAIVLVFEPTLEDLDFKRVPGFFDDRIADAINEGVASQRRKLALNLTRVIGSHSPLPSRVTPGGSVDLLPANVVLAIAADGIRIDLDLDAFVNHDDAVATFPPAPPSSLRTA